MCNLPGVVANACTLSTWEARGGGEGELGLSVFYNRTLGVCVKSVEEGREVDSVWGTLQMFPLWVLEAAALVGPDDLCIPPAVLECDS